MTRTARDHTKSLRRRLITSTAIAAGGVLAATMVVPSYGEDNQSESLKAAYDRAAQARALDLDPADPDGRRRARAPRRRLRGRPRPRPRRPGDEELPVPHGRRRDRFGRPGHHGPDHARASTSRCGDRRGAARRTRPGAGARAQAGGPPRRPAGPLRDGRRLLCDEGRRGRLGDRRRGNDYGTTGSRSAALPFHFQATDLGSYLLADQAGRFVGTGGAPVLAASETTVWNARGADGRYTFEPARAARSGQRRRHAHHRRAGLRLRPAADDGLHRLARGRRRHRGAARSPAPAPSRRCAAPPTPTPTGWPTSSSAAAPTAASPGRPSGSRSRCSTAPTTPPRAATARCWSP